MPRRKTVVQTPHPAAVFINSGQLRQRYGDVSAMWIVRTLESDTLFPRPVYLGSGRNRYWKISELEKWERASATKNRAA